MEGSVFSGMGYNPSQNTVTHYKAGRNVKPKKKRKVKVAAITKKDPSDGYSTTSVFRR
jgi:hypothetical protein